MRTHRSNPLYVARVRPLVACLAIAFGAGVCAASAAHELAATPIRPAERNANLKAVAGAAFQSIFAKSFETEPNLPAATFVVKNCDDAGPDSLRDAIAAANSLNVDSAIEFDLNAMGCSTITLSTGQITISVQNLSIGGPASDIVTIDGGYSFGHSNRVFRHTGQGILHLDHLALTDAIYSTTGNQYARGGCVTSNGTAYLSNSRLDSCRTLADTAGASGGGVWARGVKLVDSVVSNCGAASQVGAFGGGIYADTGGLTVKRSTIRNNVAAVYSQNVHSMGGGAYTRSAITLESTTVSGNHADFDGGLSSDSIVLANSTITSNISQYYAGISSQGSATIYNSTVALNIATASTHAAGVKAASIYAESSIIAMNVNGSGNNDIRSLDGHVSGSHNLIITAEATTLPPDTVSGCPRLAPLFDNGGNTKTLALLPGSPAIDAGDDPFSLGTDQRGAGFNRVVGSHADIGAYEWSTGSGEFISRSSFETCE